MMSIEHKPVKVVMVPLANNFFSRSFNVQELSEAHFDRFLCVLLFLVLMEEHPVYEADEDSYILQHELELHIATLLSKQNFLSSYSCLDMGCGSGILGITSAKKGIPTTFVDINEKALEQTKKELEKEQLSTKTTLIYSDLFFNIPLQEFDILVFNTPYLPDDEELQDLALHGGPNGNEVALRFLTDVSSYMKKDGVLFILVSSLGHPEDIETKCVEQNLHHEIIARKKLFFEELIIYKITKK